MNASRTLQQTAAVLLCGSVAGCVIPLPLETEALDAGLNSAPIIVEIGGDYQPPGPILLTQSDIDDGNLPATMLLTVRDNDLDDEINVYFYVNYELDGPTPPLTECRSNVEERDRTLDCPIDALCTGQQIPSSGHLLEAMVTDTRLEATGDPMFRSLPDDAGISFQSWLLDCQ
ncbi:MAG: hypothetical protein AAGC55_14395 [Myxococcota bacterium]